jgi:hypothetical protein
MPATDVKPPHDARFTAKSAPRVSILVATPRRAAARARRRKRNSRRLFAGSCALLQTRAYKASSVLLGVAAESLTEDLYEATLSHLDEARRDDFKKHCMQSGFRSGTKSIPGIAGLKQPLEP